MKKLHFSSREIAIAGILLAMILFFLLVPLNFIPIDVAFIPLMAVIIACQVEGKKLGIFTATAFGFASLLAAFVRPNIFSPIFYNPLVSIVPRIIIGITCYFSYIGTQKLIRYFYKNKIPQNVDKISETDSDTPKLFEEDLTKSEIKARLKEVSSKTDNASTAKVNPRAERLSVFLASTVSSAVAVITNTGLVVSMIAAFNFGKSFGGVLIDKTLILSLLGINFLIELAVCAIITPPIVLALRIALRKKDSGYWLIADSEKEESNS